MRAIDKIGAAFTQGDNKYEMVYDFGNTVSIYAGVEIIAFASIFLLLIFFVLLVNADVVRFVIAPLEKMYEKVISLSKNPMSVTQSMANENGEKTGS